MPNWQIGFNTDYAHLVEIRETVLWLRDNVRPVALGEPRPLGDAWQPPSARFIRDEEVIKEIPDDTPPPPYLRDGAFSRYHGVLALSEHAVEVLSPLIGTAAELLPLDCEEGAFYLLNVLLVLDCFDRERAEIVYREDGSIRTVRRYAFQAGCLDGKHIFRLPSHNYSRIYISQTFKDTAEQNGLKGLTFELAPWEVQGT
ncbi:MAG: DUF1629 domain-containing protein [Cyanobacteriota bacterium]